MTPPISGADLPRIGWHHSTDLDLARFEPISNVPASLRMGGHTKPAGGLWCAPLREIGGVVCNQWVATLGVKRHDGRLWEVIPKPDAKVYVIETQVDLDEAADRWPDPVNGRRDEWTQHSIIDPTDLIDWPAPAQEFDALYLTAVGVRDLCGVERLGINLSRETGGPPRTTQRRLRHLWGWDVPTVLFLQPAFTVGAAHPADADTVDRYKAIVETAIEHEAEQFRTEFLDDAAAAGVELPKFLLDLPAQGFMAVVVQIATQEQVT